MSDQNQWLDTVLSMARMQFDAAMRGMDVFPQQAEKALELALSNSKLVQEEARKALAGWVENIKSARQAYVDAVEEGLSTLESQLGKAEKSAEKPAEKAAEKPEKAASSKSK